MRIAHVTATFPPYHGGTGNVCHHNARELASRGHDVHVFTAWTAGAKPIEAFDGIAVRRLRPLVRVGNAPVLPGLVSALRGFDVIHLHYPFIGGEYTALAAWMTRTPLIVTYHQDVLLDGPMGVVERILRHSVGRATLRSAKRLLFTTLDYGRASHALPMLAGRQQHVDELPNGVDTTVFNTRNGATDLRAHLGLDDNRRIALLVAGLDRAHYFKGVDNFLEALARLPDIVVGVIVGDGELRANYAGQAERLGIASRVHFAGRVTNQALPDYYRSADVTVLPSTTMGEAFGLVLIESMASETPVIATRLPGVRAVVTHNEDGLLVDPGDIPALAAAIIQILSDEPKRRLMGQRGRAKVESQFAWPRIGARLEAIYTQVLAERISSDISVASERP